MSFKPYPKTKQLKPKDKKKSTFGEKKSIIKKKPIATKEDKEYLEYLQTQNHYKCFNCSSSVEEWHHVKLYSSDRKNHKRLIPLCRNCHTGNTFSVHGTPKAWRSRYTIQKQEEFADLIYCEFLGIN